MLYFIIAQLVNMISDEENKLPKISNSFRPDIVKEAMKTQFSSPKNKITDEALELICEISKLLVIEAAARSAKQAALENRTTVSLDHVETILPQLVKC